MPSSRSDSKSLSRQQSQLLNSHGWRKHWTAGVSTTSTSTGRSASASASVFSIICVGRILFVVVLLLVACTLGFATYKVLSTAEQNLAETQFLSITQRALVEAQATVRRRRWAGVTMANTLSEMYPSLEQWPFVECLGYERLARSLLSTSSGENMGLAMHVTPEQQPAFEEFAYATYNKLGFPNGTGTSPFGRGVWGQNSTLDRADPDYRYHDTSSMANESGTSNIADDFSFQYQSPHRITTPIFRLNNGPHPLLMFNPHSGSFQGKAIDQMLQCSIDQQQQQDQEQHCCSITDIFAPAKFGGRRYGMIMYLPIHPASDTTATVVGQITPLIMLDELLENVFADEVSGIDAVFETEGHSVTYTIDNGVARLVGEGDLHYGTNAKLRQTVELLDRSFYTKETPVFHFTLVSNDIFFEAYETDNPRVATLVTIGTILVTSLAFFLYDFFVRQEFNDKQALLEARRAFMRFVSHEVRTPLNAVAMGLDLIQSEIAKALDYDSHSSLRAAHDLDASSQPALEQQTKVAQPQSQPQSRLQSQLQSRLQPSHSTSSLASLCAKDQPGSVLTRQSALSWFRLVDEIQDNTQGAVDILNDLLNYDKIEQGTLQLALEVISMWDLVETSILEFKLPASSKQIHLGLSFLVPASFNNGAATNDEESATSRVVNRACELPDSLHHLKVIGDSVRLTQVLRNLMSNALKFTPSMGSVRVKVVVSLQDDRDSKGYRNEEKMALNEKGTSMTAISRGSIEILVEDDGAGMSPDQLAELFQDGVQFNANELQAGGGSGLGLFIAFGLAKQHNGSLTASSGGLGQGTTFSLVLPLWEVPSKDKKDAHVTPESLASTVEPDLDYSAMGTSLHVLVVDDVSSNRKLLRRLIENDGHTCEDAEDGKKAVEMVKLAAASLHPFDSLLMDYEMPILDGPSAAREIRNLGFHDVNIVGITGNVLPDDIAHFISCGANDVLPKPVKIADLDASWMDCGVYAAARTRNSSR